MLLPSRIGNSIAKILNFSQKEERMDIAGPHSKTAKRKVEQQREWPSRHLFFLSLGVSYKCNSPTLTPRSLSRGQDSSLRIAREIPRRRLILIDLLIPRRFNSALRASLNEREDVVNAFFPARFSIF